MLQNYQGYKKIDMLVVFDGYKLAGNPGTRHDYEKLSADAGSFPGGVHTRGGDGGSLYRAGNLYAGQAACALGRDLGPAGADGGIGRRRSAVFGAGVLCGGRGDLGRDPREAGGAAQGKEPAVSGCVLIDRQDGSRRVMYDFL